MNSIDLQAPTFPLEKTVSKVMREMKKKKSKGEDGISQDVILLGEKALITPITHILKSYFVVLTLKYDHKKYVKYAFPKYI